MNVLGLDIGGANIKAATADGESVSLPFAIWRDPQGLAARLAGLSLLRSQRPELIALTMTAELADCFATKAEGVRFVIETTARVFAGIPVRVWLTSGEFASPEDAIELPELVAAANWHALATWAARAVPDGPALLIDIGSTTTDLVPLNNGLPCPLGLTDASRLVARELLYTGVRRTPVCAVVQALPVPSGWRLSGAECADMPVAAELFATVHDVYLLTGDAPEEPDAVDTADGRPATRAAARNRLAHMVCCDSTEMSESQLLEIAEFIATRQKLTLARTIQDHAHRLLADSPTDSGKLPVLLSGSGDWLAERVLAEIPDVNFEPVLNLSSRFVHNVSPCAAAFAVARLAAERCRHDLLPLSLP